MERSFLDYYKEILEKVSFDSQLFYKEYKKAIKTINNSEIQQLEQWLHHKGLRSMLIPEKYENHHFY